MWCVSVCHDGDAPSARSEQFQAHAAHNIANLGRFLFTGPIATADGSTGMGDDPRLSGSIYCIDVENFDAARALMESDPFKTGGAWRQIDYYEWLAPKGEWLEEAARPRGLSPEFRCYFAASASPLPIESALMNGALHLLGSTGSVAEPIGALAILRANDMEEAKARAPGASWVVNIPIALGRFVRLGSAADLAAARG